MTWLIQSGEGEGLPHYLSDKAARLTGASHGWTTVVRDAVKFDSAEMAEDYVQRKIPTMQVTVVKHYG